MQPINQKEIAAFHALLKQHGITDQKLDIVQQLSNKRASSTKDLYSEEVQPWIIAMNKAKGNRQQAPATDPRQRMIRSIIAMAREMGVITRHQAVTPTGLAWKSDYTKFNEWMLKSSTRKKLLNDYTYTELTTLVTQYRNIYTSWLRKHH